MSLAICADLRASLTLSFPPNSNYVHHEGFLYLCAIETPDVLLVSTFLKGAMDFHAGVQKPRLPGDFWEAYVDYYYFYDNHFYDEDESSSSGVDIGVRLSGYFAFEFEDERALDSLDIVSGYLDTYYDDGIEVGVNLAWALDGDSPPVFAKTLRACFELTNLQKDENFDGL